MWYWVTESLSHWDNVILRHWVTESLRQCDTESLSHWDNETMRHWDNMILSHWVTETLRQCDTETLRHWVTGTLSHWDTVTLSHWDILEPHYQHCRSTSYWSSNTALRSSGLLKCFTASSTQSSWRSSCQVKKFIYDKTIGRIVKMLAKFYEVCQIGFTLLFDILLLVSYSPLSRI